MKKLSTVLALAVTVLTSSVGEGDTDYLPLEFGDYVSSFSVGAGSEHNTLMSFGFSM